MTGPAAPEERAEAKAWAEKAHRVATWLEWTITILATLGGLLVAAAILMVRATDRATSSGEMDLLLDLGLPALIVLVAGVVGYLVGFLVAARFRYMGHMIRTSVSIDGRVEEMESYDYD